MIVTAYDYAGTALVNAEVAYEHLSERWHEKAGDESLVKVSKHLATVISDLRTLKVALASNPRIVIEEVTA